MLTDRQRHNWHVAENALKAAERLNTGNTVSMCDGVPLLTPSERQHLEHHIQWLRNLVGEIESGRRSRPTDHITFHTGEDADDVPGAD